MKKILFSVVIAGAFIGTLMAKNDKDAVLMTVNDKPVYKSEFEYLYNKNAGQQVGHQSLDDYVEMFVNYKLKVADALANHYDTTATYRAELEQYATELAAPYMIDKATEEELVNQAYEHYKKMLKVSHIMLPTQRGADDAAVIAQADSIRSAILDGSLSWDDAAARFSVDRGTKDRGGAMGWMLAGRYPAPFEDMAYKTAVGEISQPVNSGFGVHIIRVDEERINPGEVKARHILKLTARKRPEDAAKAKEQIDSIYTVLMNGADFAEVARAESEDPGSRANGGDLDWFSSGMMVAPFDSAAFSMAEGVISHPIQTSYGWHIIEVTGKRPMKSRSEIDEQLRKTVMEGANGNLPRQRYLDHKAAEYKNQIIEKNLEKVASVFVSGDSVAIAVLATSTLPVARVAGQEVLTSELFESVTGVPADAETANKVLNEALKMIMNNKTALQARRDLANDNADYRNLLNEYTDGILLFDVSQDKVWQKAVNDREGLEKYFAENKDKYAFDQPRYKAVIVFTNSDSLETEIKDYLASLPVVDSHTIGKELKEKYGKNVRAERVIAKKGENAVTDYLAFGGEKPTGKGISWSNYFAVNSEIIDQPREADDVRSKVTADYQAWLEEQWLKDLHVKYPVKINTKVLKEVSEISAK